MALGIETLRRRLQRQPSEQESEIPLRAYVIKGSKTYGEIKKKTSEGHEQSVGNLSYAEAVDIALGFGTPKKSESIGILDQSIEVFPGQE